MWDVTIRGSPGPERRPGHHAVPQDRRELGSPARHAHHTNVPRDPEGRGSPPRLQGEQERSARRPGTGTGAVLQETQSTNTRQGKRPNSFTTNRHPTNTKEPEQTPTLDKQTHSPHEQTPWHWQPGTTCLNRQRDANCPQVRLPAAPAAPNCAQHHPLQDKVRHNPRNPNMGCCLLRQEESREAAKCGAPNYYPNSFSAPEIQPQCVESKFKVYPDVARYKSSDEDNVTQVRTFYTQVLNDEEHQRLCENFAGSLKGAQLFIQKRMVENLKAIHPDYASRVQKLLDKYNEEAEKNAHVRVYTSPGASAVAASSKM
ncbi:Catalase [Takifugu flavidus]|uniref:Catalase n=1 Tax=Takifugu flavidus TaxID=433684 RepID=A0A5C6PC24_9TELE|nr:Catalase [Takifugu flavidus]